jgi:uncharacterized protein YndB with AHSA1/START domain
MAMASERKGGAPRQLTWVSREMDAPPERVFACLTDAWLLPVWVVGATHIRDVDRGWPAAGTKVHHQVGAWPLAISDDTEVLECAPSSRFVLRGRAYPLGEAHIDIEVSPAGSGSLVRMGEAPSSGPARMWDNPLQRKLLTARNKESLARLASVVEHRREVSVPAPAPTDPPG